MTEVNNKVTRIRNKVPLEQRKRAVVACDRCRKQRTKCIGGYPCDKCKKRKVECKISTKSNDSLDKLDINEKYSRLRQYVCKLERILQAMHSKISLEDLRNNIDKLEKKLESKSIKNNNEELDIIIEPIFNTSLHSLVQGSSPSNSIIKNVTSKMVSTTDESFISFIENSEESYSYNYSENQLQDKNCSKLSTTTSIKQKQEIKIVPYWMLQEPLSKIPPKETVLRLIDVFINICETNFFYIHPQKFHEEVKLFLMKKKDNDIEYLQRNWNLMIILLCVLSIATCYEYIQNEDGVPVDEPKNSWEDPGHKYYLSVLPFIGFLLNNNNIKSIQIFQLIGVYMTTKKADIISVSIDHGYKYMYLAMEIAISNNLHLHDESNNKGKEEKEFRKRVWWSCYTLERRLGMNLGKPSLIKFEEITVSLPVDIIGLRHKDGTTNHLNQCAMIRIIYIFGKISALFYNQDYRTETKGLLSIESRIIRDISKELDLWKESLPDDCQLERLDPHKNLYRANNHLILFYYLGKIYLGKPFLLFQVENYNNSAHKIDHNVSIFINYLTSVCIDSAFNIIKILSTMKENGKIGIYSSTDLNFCNISLFVVIVFLKIDQSQSTKIFLKLGLKILESLSKGCSSAKVNLSMFKKIESKLSEELKDQSFWNYSIIDNNSTVFPEMNINLHADDFQLSAMDSMVLTDTIFSSNSNNKNMNATLNTGDNYTMSEDFFVNYLSHDLDWIQEIDLEKYI